MNRVALRYARVTVIVVAVLAIVFGGALYLLRQQTQTVAKDVADKQGQIDKISKEFLPKAQDASERLNAIKYVQDTQTKFSVLISDIAKYLPKDVLIDTIRLTGDEKMPVSVAVTSKTYDQVLALRNSLVNSPRISAADIVTITSNSNSNGAEWKGTLIIGFKPGQAK